jgi:UDP-N-acetyl-D-galactosamine dehydrogenase
MNKKIAVIGLGYVGLPLAIEFAKHFSVIGFDINQKRIDALKNKIDSTNEIELDDLTNTQLHYTSESSQLSQADFFIVTVPTPVDHANHPDFKPLISASTLIGQCLKKNDIVVYESTVYPGATEEICAPVLEKVSGLICGKDFFLGYSPERINPSDQEHTLTNTVKIVSGQNPEVLGIVSKIYETIVKAGVHRASSIKVAEAGKVIENAQRDINIAFVNELALICHRLGIDTQEVLDAAGTKWNFLKFKPGLVGGHCISVDPYYLAHKAMSLGYLPEVILAGRRVNDAMGTYIAHEIIKKLCKKGCAIDQVRVGIMGVTFKENCPDIRNSKVFDIIKELREFGIKHILICDPVANTDEVLHEYGLALEPCDALQNLDVLVVAVQHKVFRDLSEVHLVKKLVPKGLFVDVKNVYKPDIFKENAIEVWRL